MLIREYRAADAAGLRQCVIALQDFERAIDARLRAGEAMAEQYIAEMLTNCNKYAGRVLVADAGEAVVGFVAVQAKVLQDEIDEESYEYAYISDVVILPAWRGRGMGKALLQSAEDFALAQGACWLRIGVLAKNRAAVDIYRNFGFADRLLILEKTLI